jgi:D-alanyl-D-alanine carboxypeptidase
MRRHITTITVIAALSIIVAACGEPTVESEPAAAATADTTAAPTTEAPASEAPSATPVDGNADNTELIAAIEAAIDEFSATTGTPGAVAAVLMPSENGLVQITAGAGLSDVTSGDTADPSDHYRWGSITKPMTSTLILQLVEEGLIDLDEPVATYLGADWASGYTLDGIDYAPLLTIRQILNHTDGFAEYAFDVGFFAQAAQRMETPFEPEEIVAWGIGRGPQYTPGDGYAYNTVGHVVAGLVIEAVTGRDAHEVMRERLFDPVDVLPGLADYREAATVGEFFDVTVPPEAVVRSAGWTGGGLEAQSDDVARVFRSMFTGALTDDSVTEFTTPFRDTGYGLGISVGDHNGNTTFSHGGGVPGFRSDAVYLPDLDVTVVVSANLIPIEPDISSLSGAILDLVLERLDG